MTVSAHKALRASTIIAATAAFGLACGPDGPGPNGEPANVPGLEIWIDAGDGLDHGMLSALTLSAESAIQIERTFTDVVAVTGQFEDGATVDLNNQMELAWSTDDSAIINIVRTAEGAQIEALSEGSAKVIATLGTLTVEQTVNVLPPALVGLEITATGNFLVKTASQLTATATYRDNSTRDVTTEAAWSSSAPDAIAVLDDAGRKGIAYPLSRNSSTITATFEDQTATLDASVACSLDAGSTIRLGEVLPNASWGNAVVYDADGNRTDTPLSIEEMLCNDDLFGGVRAFAFSVNAGWCGPCHAWMRTAAREEADLLAAGIMPVFVVGDGTRRGSYSVATTEYANQLSTTHAQDAMSVRVGDAETMGAGPTGIRQAVTAWPMLFVVDRADMRVLSLDAGAPRTVAGLVQIAQNAGGNSGGGTPGMTNCADGSDEANEPNDIPAIAPELGVGSIAGGICNSEPDYFRVNVDGAWRATVMFENGTADIDLFGWDGDNDSVLQVNGMPVQSVSVRQNFESIELSGPQLIRVSAKARGTVNYNLFIEAI